MSTAGGQWQRRWQCQGGSRVMTRARVRPRALFPHAGGSSGRARGAEERARVEAVWEDVARVAPALADPGTQGGKGRQAGTTLSAHMGLCGSHGSWAECTGGWVRVSGLRALSVWFRCIQEVG